VSGPVALRRGLREDGTMRFDVLRECTLAMLMAVPYVTATGQIVGDPGIGIGTVAADRARLGALRDSTAAHGQPPARVRAVLPHIRMVSNSHLPYETSTGDLWAGRGLGLSLTGGVETQFERGPLTLRLATLPTVTFAQNRPFETASVEFGGRSPFGSPWHGGAASIDLPQRFGDSPYRTFLPGQSVASLTLNDAIEVGATTRHEWWGTGLRTTLLFSNTAPGVPRAYLGTPHAIRTPIGFVAATVTVGTLTESRYFDREAGNDYRALGGALLALSPGSDSTLVLGVGRLVTAPIARASDPIAAGLGVLTNWERLAGEGDTLANGKTAQRQDQIISFFWRWRPPRSGLEVYSEWARMDLPRASNDVLVTPHHTQGWLLGSQWVVPARRHGDMVRLHAEGAFVDQVIVFPDRPPPDFYTGRATSQGFTHRGQLLGSWVGPGGSMQTLGSDYITSRWQAGIFLTRVRWEDNALYRQPAANFFRHDVSLLGGIRGAYRLRAFDVAADVTYGKRLNYLFQSGQANPFGFRTVDVPNLTIDLRIEPR
jgi:hypothetical protein